MTKDRRQESLRTRQEAAELARGRVHPSHQANGDEQRYADENYPMSFTKGLEHDEKTGLVKNPAHFEAFRKAINEGFIDAFTENVPVLSIPGRRQWEAPTAGFVFDLEGPDAQAVTMQPAPKLGSKELTFEMAEIYELALVRDVPFAEFAAGGGNTKLEGSIERLNELYQEYKDELKRPRITEQTDDKDAEKAGNKDAKNTNSKNAKKTEITRQTIFRGSSPGVEVGPYLSQFLLIGTESNRFPSDGNYRERSTNPSKGKIVYGAQRIDQRVAKVAEVDFMTAWDEWLSVQNGEDTSGNQKFIENGESLITTPRDLTTYVHFDALYQAYLNACLILLDMKAPFDPDFGALSGSSNLEHFGRSIRRNANGFALFGGPHILTLVTEVATRALKAVRYQKFNNHLRLRPEALAARLEAQKKISNKGYLRSGKLFEEMLDDIKATTELIKEKNKSAILLIEAIEGLYTHESMSIEDIVKSAIDDSRNSNADIYNKISEGIKSKLDGIINVIRNEVKQLNVRPVADKLIEIVDDQIKCLSNDNNNVNFDYFPNNRKVTNIHEVIRKAIWQFISKELSSDINKVNTDYRKTAGISSILLPMAFPEGSPMHPSYGAGHATVAGACVTVLKAFFDTNATFVDDKKTNGIFKRKELGDTPIAYTPEPNRDTLRRDELEEPLTLEGELNKLAANISIGRNMAGVHFFSDYYDSLRMGEEIAIAILEEQALTYPKYDFVFSVPTFDGAVRRIGVV